MKILFAGLLTNDLVDDLLKECIRMQEFDHPNILKLIGVCLDGGPAPYIIMPFLINGSLLSYLKKNREELVLDPITADIQDTVMSCLSLLHAANISFTYGHLLFHDASWHVINPTLSYHFCACFWRCLVLCALKMVDGCSLICQFVSCSGYLRTWCFCF